MRSFWRVLAATTTISILTACSSELEPEETVLPNFTLVLNHQQMMNWLLGPAAEIIWDSAGTIITAEGERELAPTTDDDWDYVVSGAATLAEASNLLMLPGRSMGPDWNAYAKALMGASISALDAANAQDSDSLFTAGGDIYQACLACHQQYAVDVPE
jgi:mono/diheme cytochrome c family protein